MMPRSFVTMATFMVGLSGPLTVQGAPDPSGSFQDTWDNAAATWKMRQGREDGQPPAPRFEGAALLEPYMIFDDEDPPQVPVGYTVRTLPDSMTPPEGHKNFFDYPYPLALEYPILSDHNAGSRTWANPSSSASWSLMQRDASVTKGHEAENEEPAETTAVAATGLLLLRTVRELLRAGRPGQLRAGILGGCRQCRNLAFDRFLTTQLRTVWDEPTPSVSLCLQPGLEDDAAWMDRVVQSLWEWFLEVTAEEDVIAGQLAPASWATTSGACDTGEGRR